LQCVLAAKILTVDFVVCTLAVKKKIRAGFHMSDRTIPLSVRPTLSAILMHITPLHLAMRTIRRHLKMWPVTSLHSYQFTCDKPLNENMYGDSCYRLKHSFTLHEVKLSLDVYCMKLLYVKPTHVAIYTLTTATGHKDRGPAVACR
jgi:hypothetical protein